MQVYHVLKTYFKKSHFKKNTQRFSHAVLPSVLIFGIVLLLWQLASVQGYIPSFILPSPFAIIMSLINDTSLILSNALVTFFITLVGILLSIIFALISAVLIKYVPIIHHVFYPIILLFQVVPVLIFAPLLVVVLGYGFFTQLFIITLMCFFPLLITLLRGFKSVPVQQITLLQSMGAGRSQIFYWVIFPNAFFSMCSGLRLTVTYAITAAIIGEWVAATRGLGVLMITSQKSFLVERVFAINIVVVFLSIILYVSAAALEKKTMPWRTHVY